MANNHWDNYWATNADGSFGQQTPEWYRNTLIPFWENIFKELPQQARILDIATGSGAVIRLAQRVSIDHQKHFDLVACDKAKKISNPANESRSPSSHIRFIPNMPVENIDFSQQPFDLITSQFGIEYCNTTQALSRVSRSLKTDGRFIMVAHRKESFIYQQSRREIDQYRMVLQQYPVFKRLEALIRDMGHLPDAAAVENLKSNPKASQSRESFNILVAKLLQKHDDAIIIAELLNNLKPLFKQYITLPIPVKLEYIHALKRNLQHARQRLLDMLSAAMDEKAAQSFMLDAGKHGLKCFQFDTISGSQNSVLGWKLVFNKP